MAVARNGDADLYYEVRGEGEAVVLVPGLGSSCAAWRDIAPILAESFQVITPDPRGAGRSPGLGLSYTGAIYAADLAAVLDAADVSSAHVVGKSMGGMIAQEFALRYPDRVSSLVLATTYAAPDAWTRRVFEVRRLIIEGLGLKEHFRLSILFLFSPGAFRRTPERVVEVEQSFLANPPDQESYLRQIQFCLDHDTRARLHAISAPTLVIAGSEDILTPPSQSRELAAMITGAEYQELDQASHGLIWEDPVGFCQIVIRFISRHGARIVEGRGA